MWLDDREALKYVETYAMNMLPQQELQEEFTGRVLEQAASTALHQVRVPPEGKWVHAEDLDELCELTFHRLTLQTYRWGKRHVYLGGDEGALLTVQTPSPERLIEAQDALDGLYSVQHLERLANRVLEASQRIQGGTPTERDVELLALWNRLVQSYPDYLAWRHERTGGTFTRRLIRRHGPAPTKAAKFRKRKVRS